MIPIRGRYAPSPTGFLHLGNARTALVAWLRARSQGGAFLLRVEDLDGPRTLEEAVTGNLEELRWLGLDWDEGPDLGGPHAPYVQSRRGAFYEEALGTLRQKDLVFACYLSRKDLRELASAPHGDLHTQGFVYGRAERTENERCKVEKAEGGKRASLRFRVAGEQLHFEDLLAGKQRIDTAQQVGDFVVRRADGLWAYQLAVVADDIAMRINEVVRGDDLLTSTGAQLLLYRALGETPPQYLHVPLLLDEGGERMAKRKGSLTLNALRSSGVSAPRVTGLLAYTLGLLAELEEVAPADLLVDFSLDKLRREAFSVSSSHLDWLTSP